MNNSVLVLGHLLALYFCGGTGRLRDAAQEVMYRVGDPLDVLEGRHPLAGASLEIPFLARQSSPAELQALQDAWLGQEPEGALRCVRR